MDMVWGLFTRFPSHLEEIVVVELDPVLEPRDFRPREALGHAEEGDLASQHVVQLEVGRLDDPRALEADVFFKSLMPQNTSSEPSFAVSIVRL